MKKIVEYLDGWALEKDGVEIAFYNKFVHTYTFQNIHSVNCSVIYEEDLDWFEDQVYTLLRQE